MEIANLIWDENGEPFSTQFQDHYFSKNGGLEESRHVFLRGNDIQKAWENKDTFSVAETGFGTGLNFLVLWQAWKNSSNRAKKLHFITFEGFPLDISSFKKSHLLWQELLPLSKSLEDKYPPLKEGIYDIYFEDGDVRLTLGFGEALSILKKYNFSVDAWFLDGFAPSCNESLWNLDVFKEMARLSHKGTTFATFTVASKVRKGLMEVGFDISKTQGFNGKREMLKGIYI